jgi:hypothetical protein
MAAAAADWGSLVVRKSWLSSREEPANAEGVSRGVVVVGGARRGVVGPRLTGGGGGGGVAGMVLRCREAAEDRFRRKKRLIP